VLLTHVAREEHRVRPEPRVRGDRERRAPLPAQQQPLEFGGSGGGGGGVAATRVTSDS
jgi:hypothetical protein